MINTTSKLRMKELMDTSASPNYYTMVWLKEYAILIKRLKGGTYGNVDM
jgi:hypothetical protein